MKKQLLKITDLEITSFSTSVQEEKEAVGGTGPFQQTVTDCLCSETFWVPCDCSMPRTEPDWTCQ